VFGNLLTRLRRIKAGGGTFGSIDIVKHAERILDLNEWRHWVDEHGNF
jgi:hypothetical protein